VRAAHRLVAAWLLCCLPLSEARAAGLDGRWQLSISGHNTYLFGEGALGGGLRIPWEVSIEFQVAAGEFLAGSGSARWLDRVGALSFPPGWFDCHLVEGTYLDSNLGLHETPRVRLAAFPVFGEVSEARVALRPAYAAPGNYLAVTYECVTDNPLAEDWFMFAERGKQVLGKRQDAEQRRDGVHQQVRVREVASLPPEATIDLPLEDGWTFTQGTAADTSLTSYRLHRLD
jgi:hypothetical protein